MKSGIRVTTIYGSGVIVSRESDEGILSHRYLVKLDNFDLVPIHLNFTEMQQKKGGLAFFDTELKVETS